MRYLVGLILALGAMACSEMSGTGGGAGDGGSAGVGGGGGDGGQGGTATLSIFVFETPAEGGIRPLEGLQLCETDTANCVLTDVDGTAELGLPVDREISYTWEKEGYVKVLRADILSADGSYVPSNVSTDARMAARFDALMSPYPMEGTGVIYAQAFSDELGVHPIPDATFELVGATGKAFNVDDDGDWTLESYRNFVSRKRRFRRSEPGRARTESGRRSGQELPSASGLAERFGEHHDGSGSSRVYDDYSLLLPRGIEGLTRTSAFVRLYDRTRGKSGGARGQRGWLNWPGSMRE